MKNFQEYIDKNEIRTLTVSNVTIPFYDVLFDGEIKLGVTRSQFIILMEYFGKSYSAQDKSILGLILVPIN